MASEIIGLFKGKKKAPDATKTTEQKGPIVTPIANDAALAIRRRLGRGGGMPQNNTPLSDKLGR